MQYRAEFPTEFPEKPGKSIGNSALYCIFPDPGNFSILPVLAAKFYSYQRFLFTVSFSNSLSTASCDVYLIIL